MTRRMFIALLALLATLRGVSAETPPLHVEGRLLKDSSGKTVLLRGVNHHGFVDIPDGAWDAPGEKLYTGMGQWRPEVVKAALDDLRDRGFNVVRFHTVIEWWQKDPSEYQDPYRKVRYPESYRKMMRDVVSWAGERGLYVIFDFYALRNVNGTQTGQESLPWGRWCRFPKVVKNREAFGKLWESVAQELGSFPNVLFEPYNEPHGDLDAEREWFLFLQEVLPRIRRYSQNPVIIQWDYASWVNLDYPPYGYRASTLDWIARHTLLDHNLLYGTHLYRNSGGGGPGMVHRSKDGDLNLWQAADLAKGLQLMRFPGTLGGLEAPLVVTEIGANLKAVGEDRERELAWFRNCLGELNRLGVGYVGWAWQDDRQLDHGLLREGAPNEAGVILQNSLGKDTATPAPIVTPENNP